MQEENCFDILSVRWSDLPSGNDVFSGLCKGRLALTTSHKWLIDI